MHLKLIACEILCREFCAAVARAVHRVDVEFLPKGLHDVGREEMFRRLDEAVGRVDPSRYDAVLLGYGLCNNGPVGLVARGIPLVLPRAHDCITLFLGDKQRYLETFHAHRGVYFKTSGWIERGDGLNQATPELSYETLAAKYGEDNAEYLMGQLADMAHHYSGLAYIEMGIEPDDRFERAARDEAARRGWRFEKLSGDMRLFKDLVDGRWDERRFLVVPPGCRVAASYDDAIVRAEEDEET